MWPNPLFPASLVTFFVFHQSLMENFIFCAVIYLCMPEIFLVDKKNYVKVVQLSPLDKTHTAQKMKFSIKDFFSKCDQIFSFLRVWSHLLKKYLIEKYNYTTIIVSFFRIILRLLIFKSWHYFSHFSRIFKGARLFMIDWY